MQYKESRRRDGRKGRQTQSKGCETERSHKQGQRLIKLLLIIYEEISKGSDKRSNTKGLVFSPLHLELDDSTQSQQNNKSEKESKTSQRQRGERAEGQGDKVEIERAPEGQMTVRRTLH